MRGELLESTGRLEEALQCYQSGVDRFVNLRDSFALTRQRMQLSSAPPNQILFRRAMALARKLERPEDAARVALASLSEELLGAMQQENSGLGQLDVLQKRIDELERWNASPAHPDGDAVGLALARGRAEFAEQLHRLKESYPDFEKLVNISGSAVRPLTEHLRPDETLVVYYLSPSSLFVIAVGQNPTIVEVPVVKDYLAERVHAYRKLVVDPDSSPEALKNLSRELYDLLIAPLHPEGRMVLIPTGILWNVPFASLTAPDGTYLDQRLTTSYASLGQLTRKPGERVNLLTQPLLISQELPGTVQEVRAIHALLPEALPLGAGSATPDAVRRAISESTLAHFATHASQDQNEPVKSYLNLSGLAGPGPTSSPSSSISSNWSF